MTQKQMIKQILIFYIIFSLRVLRLPARQFKSPDGEIFHRGKSIQEQSVFGLNQTLGVFSWAFIRRKSFDSYNQISRNSMEEPSPSIEALTAAGQGEFECSCGKAYRSYPALFTHIKNKHGGKAPGNIKKPICPPKRRGRPPMNKKNTFSQTNVTCRSEADSYCFSQSAINTKLPEDALHLAAIIKVLEQLPEEEMDRRRLNEIGAILDMSVHLVSGREEGSLRVGWVLAQFLQQLSKGVEWSKFQQMFTLLMLLVQFTVESLSQPRLVAEGQVDLLCDHINQFVQGGLKDLMRRYEITPLRIFDEEVMLQLFSAFFQWLIAKKYTNYRITLNADFSPANQ